MWRVDSKIWVELYSSQLDSSSMMLGPGMEVTFNGQRRRKALQEMNGRRAGDLV